MTTRRPEPSDPDSTAIAVQATLWLARRDRGLTGSEQDDYIKWLTADPRHAESVAYHAASFGRLMKLYEWQPGQSDEANPDLFVRPKKRYWLQRTIPLAAAIVIVAMLAAGLRSWTGTLFQTPESAYLRVNEKQQLPDGSIVELKDGSMIILAFSDQERRVQLTGEGHFTVAKNPIPFVVQAGDIIVRAVGTAFNVRADHELVDVLVTEGRVLVASEAVSLSKGQVVGEGEPTVSEPSPALLKTSLGAGQRLITRSSDTSEFEVREATAEEIESALAWKGPQLQFFETPLSIAIEEFNRRNRIRLVLGQSDLADIPIGGRFRVDNVEAFVRLLDITLRIHATEGADGELVLSRQR